VEEKSTWSGGAELVERDRSADMIDSTIVRAHHCAVGIKRGLRQLRRVADRAAASPSNSLPDAMPKTARSASYRTSFARRSHMRELKRHSRKQQLREPAPHDKAKYKRRNQIERLFTKLKNWRRVATRTTRSRKLISAS